MPIGKNSIKRVANNGYSKVTTSAPDMDNSTVVEPEVMTEATPKTLPKSTEKKTEAKVSCAKNTAKARPVSKKETPKAEKSYYNFGDELPVYLL